MANVHRQYTPTEEAAHASSHFAGTLLSVGGLVWMLWISVGTSDQWRIVASVVYGISLIALFLSSTLYHTFHTSPHKHLLKLLDHCAIYLLIAGSYTPFLLVAMRNRTGWWLFAAIWVLAAAGIVTKLRFRHRHPRWSMASYLLMGWLVIIAGPQVFAATGAECVAWLVAGGLSYTVGAVFYMRKSMPFHHAIWHGFVLLGALCHFIAVIGYVLPVGTRVMPGV
jgi:hemolysin III